MLHLFAHGIMDFGELGSIANTLQERRFTGVGSADDENSEMNIFEVLSNFHRIQLDAPLSCDMTSILVPHDPVDVTATHFVCCTAKACGWIQGPFSL